MELQASSLSFESDNSAANARKGKRFTRSFDDLGFGGAFGTLNVNLLALPDFGYNTRFDVEMDTEKVVIKKGARKDKADIKLSFKDNRNGRDDDDDRFFTVTPPWDFGFEIKMWLSDFEKQDGSLGTKSNSPIVNRPDDNARIAIIHKTFDPPPH